MSHKKSRKSHRCGGLGKKGTGGLIVAGIAGVAVGAGGYYLYLASKTPKVTGLGLIDVQRF